MIASYPLGFHYHQHGMPPARPKQIEPLVLYTDIIPHITCGFHSFYLFSFDFLQQKSTVYATMLLPKHDMRVNDRFMVESYLYPPSFQKSGVDLQRKSARNARLMILSGPTCFHAVKTIIARP